jgi:hypothetical protein
LQDHEKKDLLSEIRKGKRNMRARMNEKEFEEYIKHKRMDILFKDTEGKATFSKF